MTCCCSALSFCSRRVRTCNAPGRHFAAPNNNVASLIGRLGSSTFRPSIPTVSMSLAGSCFSSESALRQAHLDDRDKRAARFEGGQGSAQVVELLHGVLHRCKSRRWMKNILGAAHSIFHHGIRRRGGTIYWTALPSVERQVQATLRTHLIHRPARDIIPPRGGARVSSYRMCSCMVFMMLLPVPGSSGTRCRQPR